MDKINCLFDMDGLRFDTVVWHIEPYLQTAKKHDYEVNHKWIIT